MTNITTADTGNAKSLIMKEPKKKTKKCVVCWKNFSYYDDGEVDLMDRYPTLFYKVCNECVPSCSLCGGDSGWLKCSIITGDACNTCDRDYCKSCGINITCKTCGATACENCIEDDDGSNENICPHMNAMLHSLREKMYFLR